MPGNIADSTPTHSWPKPNYEDPVTRSWLPAFAISFHVLASLLVALRLGLRCSQKAGGFGLDDAFLTLAWLLATGFVALASYASFYGLVDRHIWDIRPEKLWEHPLNAWISSLIFVVGTCLLKVSVLLFHRRIVASTLQRRWKYAVWGAIGFTVAYTLALSLMLVLNCSPTEAYWKVYDPTWHKSFHCYDTKAVNPVAGVLSIGSDVYAVVLPCLICRTLQISRRQKIALNLVFCAGLLVVAASALRARALTRLGTTDDASWTGFWVFFWSVLEYDLGLICTCVPALRVLFKRQLRDTNAASTTDVDLPSRPTVVKPPGYNRDGLKHPRTVVREVADGRTSEVSLITDQDCSGDGRGDSEEISLHVVQTSRSSFRIGPRDESQRPKE